MRKSIGIVLSAVMAVSGFTGVAAADGEADGGVVNGSFINGTEGWTIEGAAEIINEALSISGGEVRVSQRVEGLENGIYNLTADAAVSDISGECRLYGKTSGHTMASTAVYKSSTPQKIVVPGIEVEDGACDIGIYSNSSAKVTLDNVSLSKSEDTRIPFYKGGEISKLTYVEGMGGKFFREDGSEGDALQIMAENGFNLARIRVLNDPGKGHGDGTYYLPAGYQTEEDCLDMARRAKDKGMDILFSFAYSDYWSDGGQQFIPHEWQEYISANKLSGDAMYSYLENQVYEYTKDIMQKLIAQDTCPKFVSIGNEMQLGLFFGGWKGASRDLYMNPTNLARFLKAGARAVRETAPDAKVVLHSDNGGLIYSKNSNFVKTMRLMTEDFDVIGVSYYPYYNDGKVSIDNVVSEFDKLIKEFNKDVIIMETGYNWTEYKPGGEWDGQLKDSGYYQNIYGESQEGQRAFLTELYAKLKQVAGGRCIGDLYWDPVMIHSKDWKIGWAVRESDDYTDSNVVPNSTIFDFDGKAVEGQMAMKYNSDAGDTVKISGRALTDGVAAANKSLVVTINGSEVKTTTDKFGEFITAVPYPADGIFEIAVPGNSEILEAAAPYDGTMVLLGDVNVSEDEKTEDEILGLTAGFDADGILSFNADYITDNTDVVFYAAAYDEYNSLIGCIEGKSGKFAAAKNGGKYTVKAFLWDDKQQALCSASEVIIDKE